MSSHNCQGMGTQAKTSNVTKHMPTQFQLSVLSCQISVIAELVSLSICGWLVDICCCDWITLFDIITFLEPGALLRGTGRPARGLASPHNTSLVGSE